MVDVLGPLEDDGWLSLAVEVEGSLEEPPGASMVERSLGWVPGSSPVASLALFSSLNLAALCRCRLFVFQLVETFFSAMELDLCLLCQKTREFALCELRNNA